MPASLTTPFNSDELLAMLAEGGLIQLEGTAPPETAEPSYDIDIDAMLARQQASLENQIKDFGMDPKKPRKGWGPEVVVGFDTEYVTDEAAQAHRVLSYQFHLIGPYGDFQKIFYPQSGQKEHRLQLDDMLLELIQTATRVGVIDDFPSDIHLCGFFLRLDLGTLADFDKFKRSLTNIGGRLGTNGEGVKFPPIPAPLEKLGNSKTYPSYRDDDYPRLMTVSFHDVGSHAPLGSNLAAIGVALGFPKLTIPEPYSIERMDEFLRDNQKLYEQYALRDAEIAARFHVQLKDLAKQITQVRDLPSTASGHGVALLRKTLKDQGIDFNLVFGLKDHVPKIFDESTGQVRKGKVQKIRVNRRDMYEHFITKCYHGGRNECFMAGPTELGLFNDFDLAGAYTTGMVDFPVLDYSKPARISRDPEDYRGHVVGFAHVQFRYPQMIRFPALPVVSTEYGLIYPLQGESYCTAPEIEVALNQGCEISILDGVIFEQLPDAPRIFEPFVIKIRELRAKYKEQAEACSKAGKQSQAPEFWEEYIKLIGNGLYGKSAQGLQPKAVLEAGEIKYVQLPPSEITYAACAAHVTGFVRAVMSEILDAIPPHRTVVSVTTDGFLSDVSEEEIKLDGPLATRFNELHKRVAPIDSKVVNGEVVTRQKPMLSLKHQGEQIIAMKTRGQLTASTFEDKPIILAKGSVSPPIKRAEGQSSEAFKADQNQYMVDLYLTREYDTKTLTRPFVSLRDQLVHGNDVVRLTRAVRLNLEYDLKRKPIEPPVMRKVGDREHIAFDTEPWESIEQVETIRPIFDDGWRKSHTMKTLADWISWQDYSSSKQVLSKRRKEGQTGINLTQKGTKGLVIRTFLRAYTRSMWGLDKSAMSYAELANWLTFQLTELAKEHVTDSKTEVKKSDVSNAASSKHGPQEGSCPKTPETEALLKRLAARFPNLEVHRFLG